MKKTEGVQESASFENQHSSYVDDLDEKLDLDRWIDSEQNKEILRLKYEGFNQTAIAEKVGLTQSHISKILKGMKQNYYDNYR